MSCCCSCGKCGNCLVCKIVKIVVAILLTLTTIASFIGVWRTHFIATETGTTMVFGVPDGSLALLVFIASLVCWHKIVRKLCPCRNKCSTGGACPGCGNSPCTCGVKK